MMVLDLLGFDLLRSASGAWLLAAPALLALGWLGLRWRRAETEHLVAERHLARFLPRTSRNRARARLWLAGAGTILLGIALVGPVRGYTEREVRRRGLDLCVCLDSSRSMLVRDLRPDRLTRARREVLGLLEHLRGDRVALLAFSGDVREVAPLTHDRTTFAALLETVSPEDNQVGGTDLGAALERALALFDGRTGAHEAIVLLTDGEDLEGRGLEMAREAARRGVRLYAVGMATEAGGKIPSEEAGGGEGFVRDSAGSEVVSRLEGGNLAELAEITGGAYLSAASSPVPLEEIYAGRISRLEGREMGQGIDRVPHDRYQWFLVLGLACMLLETGMREKRARGRRP